MRKEIKQSLIILHSNDIHGRVDKLTRMTTLIEKVRSENPDTPVLYFDTGDIEERSIQLSNLTKGVAMYRLLSTIGCDAVTVGNAGIPTYGYQMLEDYARAASYPLVLANLRTSIGEPVPGVQPSVLLNIRGVRLGLIGVTADLDGIYSDFGLHTPPVLPLIRDLAAQLRQNGANAVILLSHLGLDTDRKLAPELQQDVNLIIGAHSHHLLSEGEWVGRIPIVQAGVYSEYLGKVDVLWEDGQLIVQHIHVLPIEDTIQPADSVLSEVAHIEAEIASYLDEIVGELADPLDFAVDRECGVANLMADVAVITAGAAFNGPLPAGPLQRKTLWNVCNSPGNLGVVAMTGSQLTEVIRRGLDPDFAKDCPRPLRGQARGLIHLSGASLHDGQLLIGDNPIKIGRQYQVAGSDWELDPFGGYVDRSWELHPRFDMPIILREALEVYLKKHSPIRVQMRRLE